MSRGIFITATGTDVGKTYVSALIVKKLRTSGYQAGYYKAALSGAEWVDGALVPGDAEYVCRTAGLSVPASSLVSYIYQEAVSPHLAAQLENRPIEMEKLLNDFQTIKKQFDFITVEGSGGIVCPLRLDEKTILLTDVIKALQLDVVIVAAAGLGTINSTVLTVEYARSHGIQIKGIILNGYDANYFMHVDNQKQIAALTGVPVIACVPDGTVDLTMDTDMLTSLYKEV